MALSRQTYSSTTQDISVGIIMIIAVQNSLNFMTPDIGRAFCTSPRAEKVWTRAGEEFGSRAGSIVTLKRALYGHRTAIRSYHEFWGYCLVRMGFTPSRANQDLWWRKSDAIMGMITLRLKLMASFVWLEIPQCTWQRLRQSSNSVI